MKANDETVDAVGVLVEISERVVALQESLTHTCGESPVGTVPDCQSCIVGDVIDRINLGLFYLGAHPDREAENA